MNWVNNHLTNKWNLYSSHLFTWVCIEYNIGLFIPHLILNPIFELDFNCNFVCRKYLECIDSISKVICTRSLNGIQLSLCGIGTRIACGWHNAALWSITLDGCRCTSQWLIRLVKYVLFDDHFVVWKSQK